MIASMRIAVPIILLASCSPESRSGRAGFVRLETSEYSDPASQLGEVFARFFADEDPRLDFETLGLCERWTQQSIVPAGGVDAGVITITGTQPGAITMTPNSASEYENHFQRATLFRGGEALAISAGGSLIAPFTEHLVAPGLAQITSPEAPPAASTEDPFPELHVSRFADFVLTWTGGSFGFVQVTFEDTFYGKNLACRFPAADGTGTVPKEAFEGFMPRWTGNIYFDGVDRVETYAGDWRVYVSATFNAVWSNGDRAMARFRLYE